MRSDHHDTIIGFGLPRPIHLLGKGFACAVAAALLMLSAPARQGILAAEVEIERPDKPSSQPGDSGKAEETVVIDGTRYMVPSPWTGNRINAQTLAAPFRQIPTDHTYNGTKLYVLSTTLEPLLALLRQARDEGVVLLVESGYRSEEYQRRIFKRMLEQGRDFADIVRYVAPPGYSQHALGTAVDFHPSNWEFAETVAYHWLKENAASFNFEETYSQTNENKMPWEAWHWNYIGE